MGLSVQYKNSIELRNFFRYLVVLPFVRPDEVLETLNYIIVLKWPIGFDEDDPSLTDFVDYFGNYWMEGGGGLALEDWNVFAIDDYRTNNHVESMHNVLFQLIGTHPNLWDFIASLRNFWINKVIDEATYRESGTAPTRKRSHAQTQKEEHLANLKRLYQLKEMSAVQYLERIAVRFGYHE